MIRIQALILTSLLFVPSVGWAAKKGGVTLVSDETIATQQALTAHYKLKNGIPLVYRKINGLGYSPGLRHIQQRAQESASRPEITPPMAMGRGSYGGRRVSQRQGVRVVGKVCSGDRVLGRNRADELHFGNAQ